MIRLKTKLGWRKKTSDRISKIKIHRVTNPHLLPWRRMNFIKEPLEKPKNLYSEEELRFSTEKI